MHSTNRNSIRQNFDSLSNVSRSVQVFNFPSKLLNLYDSFKKLELPTHLFISITIRLLLICYGEWQDAISNVPYTDIDYKVVTGGAKHVLKGGSPFDRHTYRYSPIFAWLLIPNLIWHPAIGKIIFSTFDILVAALIYRVVYDSYKLLYPKVGLYLVERHKLSILGASFWLYNPLTMVISTRGNGDSFSSFFVILTLYLMLQVKNSPLIDNRQRFKVFTIGLLHGFTIHLRLYPLLFSLMYYLILAHYRWTTLVSLFKQIFWPNSNQILLVLGTICSLLTLTAVFYHLYGWKFIYETYLYHFLRKDTKHNFSLYFLMQYLGEGWENDMSVIMKRIEKLLVVLPQFLLNAYLSCRLGQHAYTLPFGIFAITFVMVTYNTVVTSQYFNWYLALLPLSTAHLQSMGWRKSIQYFVIWLIAQGLWLLPAYLLEFQGWNTFTWLWFQSLLFFAVNNWLLIKLLEHYQFVKVGTKKREKQKQSNTNNKNKVKLS